MRYTAGAISRRLKGRSLASRTLIITAALLVVASIGLGSAFAAKLISSGDIKDKAIKNADLGSNSVNGRVIGKDAVGMSELTPDVEKALASGGAKGDKGDPGAKGDKGDKGDPGAKGDTGLTGPGGGGNTLVTPFNDQFKDNTTTASSDTPWAVTDLKCSDTSQNAAGADKGFQNGQPGGQDAPLQTGAYGFTLTDDDSVVLLGLRAHDGQALSSIDELRYSERFDNTGSNDLLAPSVEILVDNNNDGDSSDPGDDQLAFEPAENGPQGAVQEGRWQSWNVVDGNVRVDSGAPQSFESYVAAHPDAKVQGTAYAGGIRLRAESCGQNGDYDGAVDNVTVTRGDDRKVYDFEAS